MIFVLAAQFLIYLTCLNANLAYCLNRFLIVKALVGAFNKEKALVGSFSSQWNFTKDCFQL